MTTIFLTFVFLLSTVSIDAMTEPLTIHQEMAMLDVIIPINTVILLNNKEIFNQVIRAHTAAGLQVHESFMKVRERIIRDETKLGYQVLRLMSLVNQTGISVTNTTVANQFLTNNW